MDDVRDWLNGGRNYDEGVGLLLKHGTNTKLKRLYTIEGMSDFKKTRLHQELQRIYNSTGVKNINTFTEREQTKNADVVFSNPSKWPAQMDEVVAAMFQQWKPMFAERNNLTDRLYDIAKAGNETEAGKMAHRILDLDDEIDLIYERRDYYLQHGKLPDERKPSKLAVAPVQQVVALKNAERYVREFKLKLKNDPSNVKAAAKLKQWEDAVIYYKRELKIDA
jgi:hypothetical protein